MMVVAVLIIVATLLWLLGTGLLRSRILLPPGPLGNVTPFVGYIPWMGTMPHLRLCNLAKQHGDAFTLRLGSYNMVVLNSPSLIRQCFGKAEFSGRPNHLLAMALSKNGITFATGAHAVEQRRFVVKTLRDLGFGRRSMEQLVLDEVAELVRYFNAFPSGTTHIFENIFGLSVINALWNILATRKFSLDDPYAKGVYSAVIQGFIDPPVSGAVWFLPWVAKMFPNYTGFTSVQVAVDKLRGLVDEIVHEHKREFERTGVVRDFVDAYLARIQGETDPASSFYKHTGLTNLTHTLIDLFTAGSDTLNSTLNFAIRYLCENPTLQAQIHKEIDTVTHTLPDKIRVVPYSARQSVPVLDATLTETLRHSSIVTNGILHSTTSPTTLTVGHSTYNLAAGTIVMPNLYWVHHDPSIWVLPEKFDPHRFLNGGGAKHLLMPFSTGKRMCIAEQMAQVELFCFLAGLLANFTFEQVHSGSVKSGLVLNVHGLAVRVCRREPPQVTTIEE